LDLKVYDPNNNLVASSESRVNPWEIVQFLAPSTGIYTAQVIPHKIDVDEEIFGLAWARFEPAQFSLRTLYRARLKADLGQVLTGLLFAKFYTYDGAYQAESLVWGEPTPTYAYFTVDVPHPQGKPVERVRLVLVDSAGNEIATVVTFTATRSVLLGRISKIKSEWPYADAARRSALISEISGIKSRWPYAPT